MEVSACIGDKNISFNFNEGEIIHFIKSSNDPSYQLKSLIQNGYLMSKALIPSMVTSHYSPVLNEIQQRLREDCAPLREIFNVGGNSSKVGKLCEIIMGESFKKTFPDIEYEDTSGIDRNGDAIVTIQSMKIMIDYKNYSQMVPTTEIEKLVRDLKVRDIPLGILYSTKSKISRKDVIDSEIIDGKLIVFMSGEGMGSNALMVAIKYLLHLHEMNIISINDKVCELVNKSVERSVRSYYLKLLDIKDKLYRHIERIDDSRDKIDKLMGNLKEDGIHMTTSISVILDEFNELVENKTREKHCIQNSREELIDLINSKTDKKKDRTLCYQLLNISDEYNIISGISDKEWIVFFRDSIEIAKLKITKTSVSLIVYNLSKSGTISYNCEYEEIKHGDFHIVLTDNPQKWDIIKTRFIK